MFVPNFYFLFTINNSTYFLLLMNEVNMNYWFSDLKKNIDFLDELGLFIGEKQIFTKKKIPSLCRDFMAVHMKILSARFLKDRCFQVRDFSFWITEGIGLTGVSFHFWPQEHIPSGSCHTNFWLLFTSMWKIYQFLCFWA
jgi:hypothetical protein